MSELTAEDMKAIAERVYPGAVCAPVIDEFVSGKVEISGMVAYPKKAPFRFFPKLDGTDQQRLQALDVLQALVARCSDDWLEIEAVETELFMALKNNNLSAALLALREGR